MTKPKPATKPIDTKAATPEIERRRAEMAEREAALPAHVMKRQNIADFFTSDEDEEEA